jgi:hypothetical protein
MSAERPGAAPEVPEEAHALAAAWLRSSGVLEPTGPAPTPRELVRYLAGVLPAETARDVERRLTAYPVARRELVEARAALDALQSRPWGEVTPRGAGADLQAEVVRAWLEVVAEQAAASAPARARGWSGGVATLRAQAAMGLASAQSAWAAFTTFARQWDAALWMRGPALARGSEETGPAVFGPPADRLTIELERAEFAGGDLHAAARILPAAGAEPAVFEGLPCTLVLIFETEWWPVAVEPVRAGRVEWTAGGLGEAMGAADGRIPPALLGIGVDAESLPEPARRPLLARVVDAHGQPAERDPVRLELAGVPRWDAGRLDLRLSVPAHARAAYPAAMLGLDLVVSAAERQRLGEWPLGDWDDAPREVRVACPRPGGGEAAGVPLAADLRLP